MKICLISFDNWGFNKYIVDYLNENRHTVSVIDFSKFKYSYPNFLYRIYNGFLKVFLKKNIKTKFYGEKIIQELNNLNEEQDIILTIKADFIDPIYASKIRNYTKKSIAFFNDGTKRCPKIVKVLDCFDEVYSFDKSDCEKYNLKFKPNFIYDLASSKNESNEYDLFYISSLDKRINSIIKIAEKLKENNITYKIFTLKGDKKISNELLEFIKTPIPLPEIKNYISKSKVLLDIQRKNQLGLTFRVFESLGYEKKLITTNSDIKNYDFYNPNNISIIDSNDPVIDPLFFQTPYEKIDEKILHQYKIDGWIQDILKNDK